MPLFLRLSCINNSMKEMQLPTVVSPRTQESRDWFLEKLKDLGEEENTSRNRRNTVRNKVAVTTPRVGMMYFFSYDPKGRKTLPYYDKFPLTILLEFTQDGFLGLNLHYLPLDVRQKFFYGSLLNKASDGDFDDRTFFEISYEYLKRVRSAKAFRPCVKKYLTSNIRGKISHVPSDEWEMAIHLPIANWAKESESKIHRESLAKIGRF